MLPDDGFLPARPHGNHIERNLREPLQGIEAPPGIGRQISRAVDTAQGFLPTRKPLVNGAALPERIEFGRDKGQMGRTAKTS